MEQDWNPVVLRHKSEHKPVNRAPHINEFKALDSDDPPPPKTSTIELRVSIQKARNAKKLTQKELAKLINLPANEIAEYENGKKVPTNIVLSKLSKILDVKLK